jgi:RNA polymerase sigma-54 factor
MAQGLYLSQKMMLSQVLAPQLQQSLALLQAPTLELKAMVEQELQQNPILEEVAMEPQAEAKESTGEEGPAESFDLAEPPADVLFDPAKEKPSAEPVDDFQAEFERLTQMDQEWREHFSQANIPLRQNDDEEEKRRFLFDSLTTALSLQEILLEQMRQSELVESQRGIAEMIVGNIDDNGYLKATISELSFSTNIPADQIEAVLRVIQTFDPAGIAARDLKECLLLQLERLGKKDALEYTIVKDHLEALGRRRLPEIARALDLTVQEVQDAAATIGHLEPYPGRQFQPEPPQYVVPEIFVHKAGDEYVVTSNNEYIPHLRISNAYKDIMSQTGSAAEVRDYIREKIRAGKFLIKSLHQRQETILNIAREIVKRQRDFMEFGITHLKPMTMLQVAEIVGVHETTVSRAVSAKYMETPQGVFEMKYFFTSGIKTADGSGMSNTSIKDLVSEMIKKEDTARPLSDDQIVKMLMEKDIKIARRTVAKYRSELNILPSTLRKVY